MLEFNFMSRKSNEKLNLNLAFVGLPGLNLSPKATTTKTNKITYKTILPFIENLYKTKSAFNSFFSTADLFPDLSANQYQVIESECSLCQRCQSLCHDW